MKTRHLLIGWALAASGVGMASATSVDTQDLAVGQHAAVDTATGHEGGGSLDTAPARDSSVSGSEEAAPGASDANTGNPSHPQTHRGSSLGWQSLLPGSIQ